MRRRAILAAVLLSMLVAAPAAAAPSLTSVGTFDQPVHVAAPPGDPRLFVVERPGRVQVVANGQRTLFLDATSVVNAAGDEQGLLSIAFAPDFATSGLYYVFYTGANGDLVVREGSGGTLGRVLFTVPHGAATNHNGGQLAFGPDGLLYVSTGDGGDQGDPGDDAQNPASLLGKILRVNSRSGAAPEVYALGLRNPWRFSFDRQTGDLIIGDVGGSVNEEIDFSPAGTPAGANYGWVRCEGDQPTCPAGTIRPVVNLPRTAGYTGVIGGFVVRDPGLPTLQGRYVFGDITKDTVMSVALGAETTPRAESTLPVSFPTSFGEDGCGHVYVALNGGAVYRIHDGPAAPCPGSSGPPPPGGNPPGSTDTTPCALTARAPKRAQRILRRGKRLRITLRASEACTATLRAKRFRTKRVTLKANVRRIVRLTPTKRGLRRMRRTLARSDRPRLRISVRISARDAAGNPSAARIRPRLR
jgi:glucose/arabinose dehydrogenase